MELVGVKCIGENTFQIIGITNQDNEFIKANLIAMVAKLSEKAEKCYGIPKEEYAHTIPAKLVVHSTYSFMSGADIKAFLNECQNI
ncbi:MAG: hypothetical protein J6D03_01605 [Clostridia bacterium]|nr:hypothetical protein [Clostridia bacterium]